MSRDSRDYDLDYFSSAYRDYEKQNPDRKLDHYLSVIEDRATNTPLTLLDVGSGRGAFLARVARVHSDWSLYGFDPHPEAVRLSEDRIPSAQIRTASIEAPPFVDKDFDVVTAWDVLEHLPDLGIARETIQKLLRPGGLFAFVVPVYDGVTGPVTRRLDKDETHLQKKSKSFWTDWASTVVRDVRWHGVFRYLLAGNAYIHIPTRVFRRHAPAILVTGMGR